MLSYSSPNVQTKVLQKAFSLRHNESREWKKILVPAKMLRLFKYLLYSLTKEDITIFRFTTPNNYMKKASWPIFIELKIKNHNIVLFSRHNNNRNLYCSYSSGLVFFCILKDRWESRKYRGITFCTDWILFLASSSKLCEIIMNKKSYDNYYQQVM